MKSLRTTTRTFEAAGANNARITRIVLLWKLMGLKGLGRDQGFGTLAGLWLRHRFGRHFAVVTVKHEQRWMRFLRTFRQRRAVVVRRAGLIRDKLLGRLNSRDS